MKAYTCGITKEQFVNETLEHQRLDHFITGSYNNGTKGCAVGCAIKSINKLKKLKLSTSNHSQFETHLGIPEWLARVEDFIFEGVSYNRTKTWPVEFAQAINQGADLNQVKVPFIIYILKNNIKIQKQNLLDNPDLKEVIKDVITANKEMIKGQISQNKKHIESAWSAADSARSAARSSAGSAARSSAESARSAAESAAESAWSAADSARSAARSAARSSARSSAGSAARSAAESARSAAYELFADELLRLLKECK